MAASANINQHASHATKGLLFAFAMSFLSVAHAATGDIGLDVYGLSYHLDQKLARQIGTDNQFNPGLGLHYVINESPQSIWLVQSGLYRDSGRHHAKIAGVAYEYKLTEQWRLGGGVVYFNSTTYNRGRAFIAPVPLLTYQLGPAALNLTFFPKVSGFNDIPTFAAYATIRLGRAKRHAQ